MQAYLVMGGHDYEGFDGYSMQLFDCKSAAEVYAEVLRDEWNFDYVQVKLMTVIEGSALVA